MTDPARLCCVRLQRRRARSTTPPRVRAGRQRAQQPAARLRSLPPESAVRRAKGGGRGGGHAGRVGGGQDAARCNRQLKQRITACESMPELCSVIEQHAAELNKKTTLPFGPWARPWMSTLRSTAGVGVESSALKLRSLQIRPPRFCHFAVFSIPLGLGSSNEIPEDTNRRSLPNQRSLSPVHLSPSRQCVLPTCI